MATAMRVTGAWVQLLTDWLDKENLPAPDIRLWLDSRSPTDIVPLDQWQHWLANAVRLRPNKHAPGLEIGALIQPRHVGVLGYLVLSCKHLGEAMAAYQRYETLFYGVNVAQTVANGDTMAIRWDAAGSLGELADSVAIAALIQFLRRLVENPPAPNEVTFAFTEPSKTVRAEYEAFFQCPVRFNQPYTQVVFPLHFLGIPMPQSDPGTRQLLDQQARAMLLALPDSDNLDRALQQAMVRLLPEGRAQLPQLAAELSMSTRSLQRRLAQRQGNWRTLLDRTREQLAQQYLADPTLTLADIALLLGYSEHSAFSRAFKKWTGRSPKAFR